MKNRGRLIGLLMVAVVLMMALSGQAMAYTSSGQVIDFGGAVDVQPVKTTVVGSEVEYDFRVSVRPVLSNDQSQAADTFVIGVPAEATHTTITLVSTNSVEGEPSPVAMQQVLNVQNVTQANFCDQTTSPMPLAGDFDSSKTYVATTDDRELLHQMLGYPPVEGVKYYFVTSQQYGVVVMDVKTYLPKEVAAENGKVCVMAQEVCTAPSAETQAYRAVAASGAISLANFQPAQEGAEGSASWFVAHRDQIGEPVQNGNYTVGSYDEHGIYNTSMVPTVTGTVREIGPDNNGLGIEVLDYIQEFHLYLNVSVTYVATHEDLGDAAVLTYVEETVTEPEPDGSKDEILLEDLVDDEGREENKVSTPNDGQSPSVDQSTSVEQPKAGEQSKTVIRNSSTTDAKEKAWTPADGARVAGPNTGDAGRMALYAVMLVAALGVLVAMVLTRKAREK